MSGQKEVTTLAALVATLQNLGSAAILWRGSLLCGGAGAAAFHEVAHQPGPADGRFWPGAVGGYRLFRGVATTPRIFDSHGLGLRPPGLAHRPRFAKAHAARLLNVVIKLSIVIFHNNNCYCIILYIYFSPSLDTLYIFNFLPAFF